MINLLPKLNCSTLHWHCKNNALLNIFKSFFPEASGTKQTASAGDRERGFLNSWCDVLIAPPIPPPLRGVWKGEGAVLLSHINWPTWWDTIENGKRKDGWKPHWHQTRKPMSLPDCSEISTALSHVENDLTWTVTADQVKVISEKPSYRGQHRDDIHN